MNYGYYGNYYSYYNYYSPAMSSPSYYSVDKTFYLETNAYDIGSDKLVWSIQSEAKNPTDIASWFKTYSYLIINQIKSKGLIMK
jgi:hypothetical protein